MTKRYFEDFEVGHIQEYGSKTVTREEIIAFARQFDPQPMHTDEEAAKESPFGGLVASGWQTMAFCMRMMVDSFLDDAASAGAPGVETLRWLKPVRPGDVLRVRSRILDKYPSKSRPELGLLPCRHEVLNQNDEVVMRLEAAFIILRRDPEPAS